MHGNERIEERGERLPAKAGAPGREAEAVNGEPSKQGQEPAETLEEGEIREGLKFCRRVEAILKEDPAPSVETILQFFRMQVLVLAGRPAKEKIDLQTITALMKLVLEAAEEEHKVKLEEARLEGQQEERELARKKYQRESLGLFLKWYENKQAQDILNGDGNNDAKTEELGRLIFGDSWDK